MRLEGPGPTVAEGRQQYISICSETDPFSYADDFASLLHFGHPGGRVVFAMWKEAREVVIVGISGG
jgi:hypothetical protein